MIRRDRASLEPAVRARTKRPRRDAPLWVTIHELLDLGYLLIDEDARIQMTPDGAAALDANRPCYETGGGN